MNRQEPSQPRPAVSRSGDAARLPTPSELIAAVTRQVIGQNRAKRALTAALYRHYLELRAATEDRSRGSVTFRPGRVLLTGPTGSGKTLLVRSLAKFLSVPFAYASATTLSRTGYIGKKPEDFFWQLYEAASENIGRAQQGIIFLDEIDKLKHNDESVGPDVAGYGAQIDLLPVFDGTDITVQRENKTLLFDTRTIFMVAAGAFTGIEPIVERRLRGAGLTGFDALNGGLEGTAAQHIIPDDLVCFGLCEEFVARFSIICALDPLDASTLRSILLEAEGSPLAAAKAFYALHAINLEFDAAAIDHIVSHAISQGAGARGLRRLVHAVLADADCLLPELSVAGVSVVSVVGEPDGGLRVRYLGNGRRPNGRTRAEELCEPRQMGRTTPSSPPAIT